jgi:hypothetical protein
MIHYMPFTYMSDRLIGQVTSAVGPFSVCQLAESILPLDMRHWIQKGLVQPLFAGGLNTDQLQKVIAEFNQWGRIHEGRLTAMAGMFLSDQSQFPVLDEQAPTRISTLIRQYENRGADSRPDAVFRAALFLAMAQIYDEQQDEVSGTLTNVQDMEMEMVSQLAGDAAELPKALSATPSGWTGVDPDPGLQLTDQRISAWAVLACRLESAAHLYLTTSPAVFSALLDRWPEACQVIKWRVPFNRSGPESAATPEKSPLNGVIEALATTADPVNVAADQKAGEPSGAVITICVLPGRKPHEALSGLAGETVPPQMAADVIANTVFGHLAI